MVTELEIAKGIVERVHIARPTLKAESLLRVAYETACKGGDVMMRKFLEEREED